ncbi:MAG: HAD family hydrolase [Firmicutes bacterium]|nr:HAD family hydrolase [Bacillota bacterium]
MVPGLLIFDFDGTLYRGDDPFRRYAEIISRSMTPDNAKVYLDHVQRHLDGEAGMVAGDNWEAVVGLAKRWLSDRERWQEAFLETRVFMMSDACQLEVPQDLVELLVYARGKVLLAVASNSPEAAAEPLLNKLGLFSYFDRVVSDAHKPDGLLTLVDQWLPSLDPGCIFSVGDNYANDIAPGLGRGWKTAHISPHGHFPGPADVRGRRLEEVLPTIRAWVDEVGRSDHVAAFQTKAVQSHG